jgi:hypothetical protein
VDIKFLLAIVATEALIELWKKAAPLQGFKQWLITNTPFLYSDSQQTHLLDCPYCCSAWLGFGVMAAYLFMDTTVFLCFAGGLSVHRLSNFLHLIFSVMRDRQLDIRIARRK